MLGEVVLRTMVCLWTSAVDYRVVRLKGLFICVEGTCIVYQELTVGPIILSLNVRIYRDLHFTLELAHVTQLYITWC
jgi:hypothetical protein